MRITRSTSTRLGWVGFVTLGVALIIACGDTDPVDTGAAPDGGNDSTPTTPTDGSPTNDGTITPSACDPAATAACGAGRKCDAALGCVECLADPDCTAAAKDPFCILGRCEACRTNADCGAAAPSCFPGDHTCHRSCVVDGGSKCAKEAPICDTATGACIGCNIVTDCPATDPICEPTTKSCVKCSKNADCPAAAPKCVAPRFECAECIANVDCGPGKICSGGGKCEVGCTSDQSCANTPAPKCNVASGQCVQCLGAADCAATPKTPICTTGDRGRCVQCERNIDCGDGGTPVCAKNQCVQCKGDNDCPIATPNCNKGTCGL